MGTKESQLHKLAKELGYNVTKKRKKKFASMLTMELVTLHGKLSLPHFTKGMSFRQIKMRMIKHPRFKKILDKTRLRPTDITLQIPDSSKFHKDFDWKPIKTLNDICDDLLNYWREVL